MSHTISLSLRPDPASFLEEKGKEVKDRGFRGGGRTVW